MNASCLFYRSCLSIATPIRFFKSTPTCLKKELRYTKEGNHTVVEGVEVPSERSGKVVSLDGLGDARDMDPISSLGLELCHTFLRPDGTILPRSISKISLRNQLHVEMLIERAQKAGLLPIKINSDGTHVYQERCRHRFNVYYDSRIVGLPKLKKIRERIFSYNPPE